MDGRVTLSDLRVMKARAQKIVAVVVYDYQMAQIADRAAIEIVSVGDSVGVNIWGHSSQLEVTLDQMVTVCQAVRRGVRRALLSCDIPFGPLQESADAARLAALRLVGEGGADLVKLDGAQTRPEGVEAIARAGVPVWAQFGHTPHTTAADGTRTGSTAAWSAADDPIVASLVDAAKTLEAAGASMLDFTHSGPVAGPAVAQAVAIPVLGGLGGGPWLDGRIRSLFAAIGYSASALDDGIPRYGNVAEIALAAINALSDDVRAGRQIRGERQ